MTNKVAKAKHLRSVEVFVIRGNMFIRGLEGGIHPKTLSE
jgi:hypothetical protein